MHPRNRYNIKPDFGQLAEFRPSLKPFLIKKKTSPTKMTQESPLCDTVSSSSQHGSHHHSPSRVFPYSLDFSNPVALRELTCAVLERDFDLKVELPLDRLIPAVPQRLNYIHWVEDLLTTSTADGGDNCGGIPKGESIIGIDVGTGASCIYPLLGCRMNDWRFLATDVDSEAVKFAVENVERNGLSDKIEVKLVPEKITLIGALDTDQRYSFCMCNPPFFKDSEDRYGGSSRTDHRPTPSTFSGATAGETVTEGGELEFVKRIIQDSLVLNTGVRWYSSMLGKKASLKTLLSELKKHQVPVVTSTEFVQGKTWRWALAWSFDDSLKDKVKKHLPVGKPAKRPRPITVRISPSEIGSSLTSTSSSLETFPTIAGEEGFLKVRKWLLKKLSELKIECSEIEEGSLHHGHERVATYSCLTTKNTWSHQRKKKRLLERLHEARAQLEQPVHSKDNGGTQPSPMLCDTTTAAVTTETVSTKSVEDFEPQSQIDDQQIMTRTTTTNTASLRDSTDLSFEELQKQTEREIEALSPPCSIQFKCSLVLSREEEEQMSLNEADIKRKRSTKQKAVSAKSVCGTEAAMNGDCMCCLEFEWIHGNDKDQLHQIVQYIKNKLEELKTSNGCKP